MRREILKKSVEHYSRISGDEKAQYLKWKTYLVVLHYKPQHLTKSHVEGFKIELEFQNERKRIIITKEIDEIILNVI